MRQCRTISASMERPHSPKTPSSPAAADTLSALLEDLGAQPRDFDCIVTGDLGHIGADLLLTLLRGDSIDLSPVYSDCGSLIFVDEQDAHAGGSGCGCSAAVLCGPLLRDMHRGKIHRLVFAGTGAMMSPTSVQQGQPIAGICHAVVLERSEA
jgi:stage V sporulation protein AD